MGEPTLKIDGPRATISLQRPDKRNRIEPADLVRLLAVCDEIEADPNVRVVVLTSSGPSFCAGYHLGALAEGTKVKVGFGDICDRIESLRVPVIARIGGNIHGGGTDLAISCDFRIAVESIHLLMPAGRLGIQYYGSGLRRFVNQIGPGATKRIFLTALPFPAEELLRIDYLHEVVAEDQIDQRIDDIAQAIIGLAPIAVTATKAAINGLASGSMTVADADETARQSLKSNDHREALAALKEKRPPEFTGT